MRRTHSLLPEIAHTSKPSCVEAYVYDKPVATLGESALRPRLSVGSRLPSCPATQTVSNVTTNRVHLQPRIRAFLRIASPQPLTGGAAEVQRERAAASLALTTLTFRRAPLQS